MLSIWFHYNTPLDMYVLAFLFLSLFSPMGLIFADDFSTPLVKFSDQYTADAFEIGKDGVAIENHITYLSGKIRVEFTEGGQTVVFIVRLDLGKVYRLFPAQKIVGENLYHPRLMMKLAMLTAGPIGTIEETRPDLIDGTSCTRYTIKHPDGAIWNWWIDSIHNRPSKVKDPNGPFEFEWKHFTVNPQNPLLFLPPAGYIDVPIGMPMPKQPR